MLQYIYSHRVQTENAVHASRVLVSSKLETGWRFGSSSMKRGTKSFSPQCSVSKPSNPANTRHCLSQHTTEASNRLHFGFRHTWHWVSSGVLRFCFIAKMKGQRKFYWSVTPLLRSSVPAALGGGAGSVWCRHQPCLYRSDHGLKMEIYILKWNIFYYWLILTTVLSYGVCTMRLFSIQL